MTIADGMNELSDTGQKAVALAVAAVRQYLQEEREKELRALDEIKADIGQIKRMKEEEHRERDGFKIAAKRAIMQFLTGIGFIETDSKKGGNKV